MIFSFLRPQYLFFLFLIPLYLFLHFFALRSTRKKALNFANFEAIEKVKGVELVSKNIAILVVSLIIIFLLVMSVSGLTLHTKMRASAFSYVLAIDTSRSMEANDFIPSRLATSKEIAISFVDNCPWNVEVGVVSFSGNSLIEQDVTRNKELLRRAINEIEISSVEGTDIYEAVITSSNLLRNRKGKAIILISDGQLNVASTESAIEYANDNDVLINTIGIGTEEGGKTSFGISKIDEDVLKALSYNTGGNYFRAENREDLENYFSEILNLTERKVALDLTLYLLIAVIILFTLEYLLISYRYRGLP